jgi:hypothetical protein
MMRSRYSSFLRRLSVCRIVASPPGLGVVDAGWSKVSRCLMRSLEVPHPSAAGRQRGSPVASMRAEDEV